MVKGFQGVEWLSHAEKRGETSRGPGNYLIREKPPGEQFMGNMVYKRQVSRYPWVAIVVSLKEKYKGLSHHQQ